MRPVAFSSLAMSSLASLSSIPPSGEKEQNLRLSSATDSSPSSSIAAAKTSGENAISSDLCVDPCFAITEGTGTLTAGLRGQTYVVLRLTVQFSSVFVVDILKFLSWRLAESCNVWSLRSFLQFSTKLVPDIQMHATLFVRHTILPSVHLCIFYRSQTKTRRTQQHHPAGPAAVSVHDTPHASTVHDAYLIMYDHAWSDVHH